LMASSFSTASLCFRIQASSSTWISLFRACISFSYCCQWERERERGKIYGEVEEYISCRPFSPH
jgi:hypothetical protein